MTQVMYVIHLASRIITANASNFKYWMLCELVHTELKRGETNSRKTKRGAPRRHFSGRGPLLFRWWVSVMKSARKRDTKNRDFVSAGGDVCAGGNRASGGAPGNDGSSAVDQIERQAATCRMLAAVCACSG